MSAQLPHLSLETHQGITELPQLLLAPDTLLQIIVLIPTSLDSSWFQPFILCPVCQLRVTWDPSKELSHFLCLSADSWTFLEFLYSLSLLFHQNLGPLGNSGLTVSNFSSLLQKQSPSALCRHMGPLGNTALLRHLGMKSTAAGRLSKEISNSIKK